MLTSLAIIQCTNAQFGNLNKLKDKVKDKMNKANQVANSSGGTSALNNDFKEDVLALEGIMNKVYTRMPSNMATETQLVDEYNMFVEELINFKKGKTWQEVVTGMRKQAIGSDKSLDSYLENIYSFEDSYKERVNKVIIPELDQILKKADSYLHGGSVVASEKDVNVEVAADYAQTGLNPCNIFLKVTPQEESLLKRKAGFEKVVNSVDQKNAAFYTSEFHKKHANTMVFGKAPFIAGSEEKVASDKFTTADNIYGMIYLNQSIDKAFAAKGAKIGFDAGNENDQSAIAVIEKTVQVILKCTLNGESIGSFANQYPLKEFEAKMAGKAFLPIELIPSENSKQYKTIEFLRNLAKVRPGEYNAEIELFTNYGGGAPFLTSSFTLDCSNIEKDKTRLLALADKLENKQYEEQAAKVFMPKPLTSNAAVESQIKSLLKADGDAPLKISLQDGWYITKNNFGIPEKRSFHFYYVVKDAKGRCQLIRGFMKQDYAGSGKYGSSYLTAGRSEFIKCENINK